jgi:hypothetical protein
MSTRQYYDQLLVDNMVTAAAERDMLQAFVASIGAERSLCEYARTYLAEARHNPPRQGNWDLTPGNRYDRSGGGHPDSFPPNFQDR